MSENIGTLEAQITASYTGLEKAEKASKKSFSRIESSMSSLEKENNKLEKSSLKRTNTLTRNATKQKKSFGLMESGMKSLINPYTAAAALIVAVAAASIKLGKAVTSVNATIENAGVKWEVLLGGMDDANDRMSELQNFAAKTPFKFEGISKASTILQSFGGDSLATGDSLTKLGDMSALAQRPIEELAMHYGRMYDAIQSGRPFGESALRMQELGLMSGKTSNQLNRMSKAGEDSNKMWKVFLDSTAHADGLMNKLAKTWDGLSSTLADNLKIIFQEGSKPLFDGMKIELENLLNYVIANKETITKWLNDWFNGTAKIVAITADLAGFLGDAVVAVAEFTNSDTQFEALDKKARMFASSIVEIDSMIRDATKSQEAYNKTGDSSFAKQIGLNISALKKQRSEQKSNLEQIKSQLKNIKNLGDAEEKLSEARAARRERLEAEKKAMEEQATKLRLAAEANNKVSDSILKTIVGYDNKTRAMRLAGQEQLLFNDLLAAGIEGEKAFTIAVAGESDIHKKNIANLQKSIAAHESMKQTLDAANKAGEAKTAIDNGMKDTIKELTSDINNQKNALKATKQEQQQYNDLMKTGISSAAAWNLVNNKNTDGYVKQASAIKILSNELATLNNPKEKEATFNEKMIKFFDDMKKQSEDTALLVQGVFTSAFDNVGESMSDAIIDGKMEWDSMFKSIFSDITKLIAKNLEMQAMSSVGSSMFGASSGSIIPHANGGVIGSPTYFPMGGSNTGLMGEAGPEAIMPLTRVGGKLGVETNGDSNGGNRTVNINVVTPTGNLSKQTLDQMSSEAHRFIRA